MSTLKTTKIPFTSKLEGIKDIEKRNKVFHALPVKERRQEMAYDAIQNILLGIFIAESGEYWNGELYNESGVDELMHNDSEGLQQNLLNLKPNSDCAVCARGALVVSLIRCGNKVTPDEFDDSGVIKEMREAGFSRGNLKDMEMVFEGWSDRSSHPYHIPKDLNSSLLNIFCNVIANGNFNIKRKKLYAKEWGLID